MQTLATNRTDFRTRPYGAMGDAPYRANVFEHRNDFVFATDVSRLTWRKTAGQTSPTTPAVVPGGVVAVTIASEASGEQCFFEPALSFIHKAGFQAKLLFDAQISSATAGDYMAGWHATDAAVFLAAPQNGIFLLKAAGAATAVLQVWKAGSKTKEWTTDIVFGTNPHVIELDVECESATQMWIRAYVNGFPVRFTASSITTDAASVTGTDMPTVTLLASSAYRSDSAAATWSIGTVAGELLRHYTGGVSGFGDSSGSDGGAGGGTSGGGPGLGSGLA